MYKFRFNNIENASQYEELIKEFLQPSQYEIVREGDSDFTYDFQGDREEIKRRLFTDLAKITGKRPRWGILTGIRPVKLAGELADRGHDPKEYLKDNYLVEESKAALATEILDYQRKIIGRPARNSLSMYLGIPFCPTRCLYCSFTSNQVPDSEIERYLEALHREIDFAASGVADSDFVLESVYFGGGTPTTLNASQLDRLLSRIGKSFDLSGLKEFTVEAGRPDTIDEEKLRVLKAHGVDRISINPQTMKEKTLELIGRRHTVEDVYRAFEAAHKTGFEIINTDLIAGLPEESFPDFARSLEEIVSLGASNITLHTLAVKRASKLKEMDENFNYRDEELREQMLDFAHETLRGKGFRPYYLYRQKHTSGNTENTGFCLDDRVSAYNIRIMEEAQSILALGAGGISKIYFPDENRLERVANVSNYEIYIERLDEMLDRKRKGFFIEREEKTC
ncbi:MAG: coproporphyrinogen dehydrogenase HemZ [Clostridia bacterium]|nr:coproporphyrinogen dehydrogenase HemZ [Clostridia bacterium]